MYSVPCGLLPVAQLSCHVMGGDLSVFLFHYCVLTSVFFVNKEIAAMQHLMTIS